MSDDPAHPDYAHRLSPKLQNGPADRALDWFSYGITRVLRALAALFNR